MLYYYWNWVFQRFYIDPIDLAWLCKCLTVTKAFAFFKENEGQTETVFFVVINNMPQILSIELNLYWTWDIIQVGQMIPAVWTEESNKLINYYISSRFSQVISQCPSRYLIPTPAVLSSSPPSLLSGPFGLLLSAQMERDPSVTSIGVYYLYLCTKERGEKPWHCGVYWLSIKWALSDDRDVIYEAEGETLWLSYVRTSLRMKAAHRERW